jgi:hypothetical protein
VIESWNDGQLQPSRVLIFESSPLLDYECTLLKERGELRSSRLTRMAKFFERY